VAEKVSFRLVDALFKDIQAEARQQAGRRAAAAGVVLPDLLSSDQEMQTDFAAAEAQVARRFRNRSVFISRDSMTVNDLVGFKMYGRYLPETIASTKFALFGKELDGGLLDAFSMKLGSLDRLRPAAPPAATNVPRR